MAQGRYPSPPSKTITPGPNAFAQRLRMENQVKSQGNGFESDSSPVTDEPPVTGKSYGSSNKSSSNRVSQPGGPLRPNTAKSDKDGPEVPPRSAGSAGKKNRHSFLSKKGTPSSEDSEFDQSSTIQDRPSGEGKNQQKLAKLIEEGTAQTPSSRFLGRMNTKPTPPAIKTKEANKTPSSKEKSPHGKRGILNRLGLTKSSNQPSKAAPESSRADPYAIRNVPNKAMEVLGTQSVGSRHLPMPSQQPKFGELDLASEPDLADTVLDKPEELVSPKIRRQPQLPPKPVVTGNKLVHSDSGSRLRVLNERLASLSTFRPETPPGGVLSQSGTPPTPPSKSSLEGKLKYDRNQERSGERKVSPFSRSDAKGIEITLAPEGYKSHAALIEAGTDVHSVHGAVHGDATASGKEANAALRARLTPEREIAAPEDYDEHEGLGISWSPQQPSQQTNQNQYSPSVYTDTPASFQNALWQDRFPTHPSVSDPLICFSYLNSFTDFSSIALSIPITRPELGSIFWS